MSEVFFEKIFLTRPWKALFVTTDDSIKEWWFRWKIDRYVSIDFIYNPLLFTVFDFELVNNQSIPAGMLFGFGYHLLKQYHILDDHNHGYLFSRGLGFIVAFGSFAGIMV